MIGIRRLKPVIVLSLVSFAFGCLSGCDATANASHLAKAQAAVALHSGKTSTAPPIIIPDEKPTSILTPDALALRPTPITIDPNRSLNYVISLPEARWAEDLQPVFYQSAADPSQSPSSSKEEMQQSPVQAAVCVDGSCGPTSYSRSEEHTSELQSPI